MIYLWLTLALLVLGGLFAAAAVRTRFERRLGEQEIRWAAQVRRLESALAEKALAVEAGDRTIALEGLVTVCRRMENRLAKLEGREPEPPGAEKS